MNKIDLEQDEILLQRLQTGIHLTLPLTFQAKIHREGPQELRERTQRISDIPLENVIANNLHLTRG